MGWLGARILKKPAPEPEAEAQPQPEQELAPAGPPLLLLVPPVAGVSSYRAYRFSDAASAAAFIQSSVPPELRRGMLAFWALHAPPPDLPADSPDEALVLIGAQDGTGQLYVVSFLDIESAQSFARFEVKRGLDLGLLSIYWAHMIRIHEDEEGVTLTPEAPPQAVAPPQRVRVVSPTVTPAAADDAAPAADGGSEPHLPPEVDAEDEPALVQPEDEEPELDLFAADDQPPGAPFEDEDVETAVPPVSVAEDPQPAPAALVGADGALWSVAGDDELVGEGPPSPPQVLAATGEGEESTEAGAADSEGVSSVIEISKALRVRRWQKRDDPFQGFGSPPGRF